MGNAIDQRIERVNTLLDRLDRLPAELDEVERRLYEPCTARTFADLVDRRRALLIEKERVERELKENFKIILGNDREDKEL